MGEQREEIGRRLREGEPQRARVGRLHADLRKIVEGALVVRLGVDEHVEHRRVVGGQGAREHAADRIGKILRGDRLAVGPAGVGAQVEGVGEAVGRHVPALGDAGHRMAVDRILGDQALEEGRGDIDLGQAGDDVRVEVREVGAEAAVQHLFADAAGDVGLALSAAGKQKPTNRHTKDTKEIANGGPGFTCICASCFLRISATAWAAMARPRPMSSLPSLVVALRPMASTGRPVDRRARPSSRRGAGRSWVFRR